MSLLKQRVEALANYGRFTRDVIARLEEFLARASDDELFRMSPIEYSAGQKISEKEATDLFTYAAKAGLCDINWDILCPMCGGILRTSTALKNLEAHGFCATCNVPVETTLDDAVEVSFTVSKAARPIRFHRPDDLSSLEDLLKVVFSSRAQDPDVAAHIKRSWVFARAMARLESFTTEIEVGPGLHRFVAPREHASAEVEIVDAPDPSALRVLRIEVRDGSVLASPGRLAPGKLSLEIRNHTDLAQPVVGVRVPTQAEFPQRLKPFIPPILSGKRLLTTQSFRDLFRAESISPGASFEVRELTFMFTDLKGSTEMYERIGDLSAYRLVREHFKILGEIVESHEGAIVKTIGDAVMATFDRPLSALEAAILMHDRLGSWNRSNHLGELELKIGVHDGPCIAVDSNDRVDYFGQTVNMAARIQGLAQARETYFSEAVYAAPGVDQLIRDKGIAPEPVMAALKGITDEARLFRTSG